MSTEPTRKSAVPPSTYREGWDAYMAGTRKIGVNPHEFGSPSWAAWREGFTDAEGERHKELVDRGL